MICGNEDVVPIKFRRSSGLGPHSFKIANKGRHHSWNSVNNYTCNVFKDNAWQRVTLNSGTFSSEIEALQILSCIDGETERQGRYISIHSAYEAVVKKRAIHLSAIRHALAHSASKLTNPDVISALTEYFDGVHINLRIYTHQKIYYRCIAEMLIAIDDAIFTKIMHNWSNLVHDVIE